jgi:hypothetical protein
MIQRSIYCNDTNLKSVMRVERIGRVWNVALLDWDRIDSARRIHIETTFKND